MISTDRSASVKVFQTRVFTQRPPLFWLFGWHLVPVRVFLPRFSGWSTLVSILRVTLSTRESPLVCLSRRLVSGRLLFASVRGEVSTSFFVFLKWAPCWVFAEVFGLFGVPGGGGNEWRGWGQGSWQNVRCGGDSSLSVKMLGRRGEGRRAVTTWINIPRTGIHQGVSHCHNLVTLGLWRTS